MSAGDSCLIPSLLALLPFVKIPLSRCVYDTLIQYGLAVELIDILPELQPNYRTQNEKLIIFTKNVVK